MNNVTIEWQSPVQTLGRRGGACPWKRHRAHPRVKCCWPYLSDGFISDDHLACKRGISCLIWGQIRSRGRRHVLWDEFNLFAFSRPSLPEKLLSDHFHKAPYRNCIICRGFFLKQVSVGVNTEKKRWERLTKRYLVLRKNMRYDIGSMMGLV